MSAGAGGDEDLLRQIQANPTAPALDPVLAASLAPDAGTAVPAALLDTTGAAPPGSIPPSGVPIVPPPDFGPPAPSPTDALMAQQPPAPGGIPTRDPDKDFAPGVPSEAPGNVGAPAPLPGQPGYQPPAPPAAPGTTGDVTAAMDDASKAKTDADEAHRAELEGGQGEQDAKLEAATANREAAEEHIHRAQEIQDRYDQADKAAATQVAQTQQALKDFKFRDYWADKSSGQRVLSALAVALGGLGAGLTHTPNYALQILDKEMDDDHRMQVENLNKLTDADVVAHTGIADARAARTRANADLDMTSAAKKNLIAAQLEEGGARSTDANYKNVVASKVADMRAGAAADTVNAKKLYRSMNLEDQQKEALRKKDEAMTTNYLAHAAGTGGYAPKHKGGGAGGGGAGGASTAANAGELAKRIRLGVEENGVRRPLTQDEAIAAAAELHIPLNGKPSQTTLTSIMAGSKFNAEESRKDQRAGIAGDRMLSKEAESWKKENGVDQIAKTQRELGALQKEMADNPHNPLQQALAVEKAVSAARGGAASKQALSLALGHLGGTLDNAEATIQKMRNGEIGAKQMENFNGFINGQLGAAQNEGKKAYDSFNKYIETQPPEKKAALTAERGRIFSGLHGFGGNTGNGVSPEIVVKARAAVADPSRAPAVRAAAQKIIDQAGASGG